MENKYYTPEISEFHVGFAIEINVEGVWLPVLYMENFKEGEGKPTILDTFNQLKSIRVKYLDKSDIVKVGYKENLIRADGEHYDNEDRTIVIVRPYCDTWVLIKKRIPTEMMATEIRAEIRDFKTNKYNTLFNGKIKNKSELKRIMSMIGI